MPFNPVFLTTRPAFLSLTPVCVLLGIAVALDQHGIIHQSNGLLAAAGALLAHIGVNTLNEFRDFNSGLDMMTNRTPFSGGSGALPDNPAMARVVLIVGVACLAAMVAIGIFFIDAVGWGILPVGALGLVLIVGYGGFVTNHPYLCLVAPGLGFGILFVAGTAYVVSGRFIPVAVLAALVPFFLCNNLLLLNQFPDIEADRRVGRRSFPIVYGTSASAYIYAMFLLGATLTIVIGVGGGVFPGSALAALVFLPPGLVAFWGALTKGSTVAEFTGYLGCNVAAALLGPLSLAVSILLA